MMKSPVKNALELYTPLQRTNSQTHLRRPPARRATFLLLLGCLCLGLAISWRADATKAAIYQAPPPTLTVNNTGDTNDANAGNGVCADSSNNCTLRAAVQEAGSLSSASGETVNINFSVTGTITLTLNSGINRTLFPGNKININGPGASLLTVDANGANRVFYIVDAGSTASSVSIKGLTLKGGDVSDDNGNKGGVIYQTGSSASSLTLDSVVLTGGTAQDGGGLNLESGTFTIANSTISGNTALGSCGGIFLNFGGNLTITNSTISGNYGVEHGGGICNQNSTVTIRKSTITLNQAGSGGGIHNYLGGNLTLGNSVVAGNTGLFATPRPDIWNEPISGPGGAFTDEGYNVVGKLDGANDAGTVFAPGVPNSNHNYVGTIASPVNARLAPLADNGGPTQTHALLAGSPAIDHGSAVSGVTTDQRGQPRPFDNTFVASASGGEGSDIGAFEEQSSLDPGPTELTLGNYPNPTVSLGADANVTPDTAPTNATGINVSTSIGFKGTFAADPTTGVVGVTNASPAGTYTVTVTAFNGDGTTTSKTFQLTVQAGVACTGTSFFTNATDVAVGSSPFSAAVGDFNGDGKQDLVVGNSDNSGAVSIRLGNGSGGFSSAPTVSIGIGNRPAGVAVGDFNGDGKQDLAIANNASSTVMILLGDGAGGFSSPIGVGVGTNPISVAVGDFNNDGKQDLAVGNFNSGNVSIRLGDGVGGFGGSTNVGVGTRPFSVAVGDFNNDGKQDFAVANSSSNTVSIRLGDGAGNFSNAPDVGAGSGPRSVAVGDFNGDGKQDLAAGNNLSVTVSIRLGDVAGNFSGSTNVGVGSSPSSVAIGDFNNDGRQDFAAANAGSSTVSIRLGDGSGGFSGSTNVGVGPNTQAVVVGDFNNDGRQDFAAVNSNTSTVSIRLGACDAPTITASPVTRQAGSPVSNSTIAGVNDTESGANGVTITVTSANPSNGVTVSNIINTNGTVTANVEAACGATNASFTLTATDGNGATTAATLTVNVSANTQPSLVYPTSTSVVVGNSINVTPTTAADNGSIVSYSIVSVSPAFTTAPTIDSSGVLSITNAQPLGNHTITVRATDNCNASIDASYTLAVTATPTLIVTKIADTNDGVCDADCSLREAIAVAASGDTIVFASPLFDTAQTVTLTLGELVLTRNLTINGRGANQLTVSGNNMSRVFWVQSGYVTLDSLTVTGGRNISQTYLDTGYGGGILNHADLTIRFCVVSGNSISDFYDSNGGGIANGGGLNIENSTISGNSASGYALDGGGAHGGGIFNAGGLTLRNSTVRGNSVDYPSGRASGGGIYNNEDGRMGIFNSTISGNTSSSTGGGIGNEYVATIINTTVVNNSAGILGAGIYATALTSLRNTIVAENTASIYPDIYHFGIFPLSHGNNLIGNSNTGITNPYWRATDKLNVSPRLAPLGNNGGATQTYALLPDSPAINAGSNCVLTENGCGRDPLGDPNLSSNGGNPALTTDQRGAAPFPRKSTTAVDIGAYELQLPCGPDTIPCDCPLITISPQTEVRNYSGKPYMFIPYGRVGTPYSQTFTANNASAPVVFDLIGRLPEGLSLTNNVLSGTPLGSGGTQFTLTATDANGCTSTPANYTTFIDSSAYAITGQATFNGNPLAGVTVTLIDQYRPPTTATTDANGQYSFPILAQGGYTVTPTKTNYTFMPASSYVGLVGADSTVNFAATSTATQSGANGAVLISEFRLQGTVPSTPLPNDATGERDEFIELYNNTDAPVDISGYQLDTSAGFNITVPANTTIPARGHFLIANADGYSLTASAAPDLTYSGFDLPLSAGLALLDASNQMVDGAGFTGTPAPYFEGAVRGHMSGSGEYSFVRILGSGRPQDTGDNAGDFVLISPDPATVGSGAVLGAPGPEGLDSPTQHNATVKASLIDPMTSSLASPNRVRSGQGGLPGSYGTLSIQRRFKNATGAPVTRLRFRVVDITTLNSPVTSSPQADLRVLTSTGVVTNSQNVVVATVTGLTLETPPDQDNGGGLNSSLTVVLPGGALAAGNTIDVQFLLSVQQQGAFRFLVNVEALVGSAPEDPLVATKAGGTKAAGSRKGK